MKIAIIGCGNMGGGMARTLSKSHQLALFDRHEERVRKLAQETKGNACKTSAEAIEGSEIVIIAIKPQDLNDIAEELNKSLTKDQLVISILAGVTTDILKRQFKKAAVLRVMPNLAAAIGQGVMGAAINRGLSVAHKKKADQVLSLMGSVFWMPEEKIDALTSISGSGLAFAFVIIEAMIDSAILLGINAETGQEIVLKMLQGAIAMIEETGEHPAALKWQVTSPAGTTIAGLEALENAAVRAGINQTFVAAYQRALELKREKEKA